MTIITQYAVRVAGDSATVTLESDITPNLMGGRRAAIVDFAEGLEPTAFVNRGGFLTVRRPIELFGPFLALLQHESPLNLDDAGVLSTGVEPVSDDDPADLEPA